MANTFKKTISFKHSGNMGDVIYSLSGIKTVCLKQKACARIYLQLDKEASYYEGARHPVTNSSNIMVMLNQYMADMAKPLLEAQPYIESAEVWQGEKIDIDLDRMRQVSIGIPGGDIRTWYGFLFPDMYPDLSQQVISLPRTYGKHQSEKYGPYILVNRTERYLSTYISYSFLRHYPDVLFAGTKREYELFLKFVPNAILLQAGHFLDLAHWIRSSKVFIGNQSMCYAIAEQMKTPRVLEVCSFASNVIPIGKNGYGFYAQTALEYYVEKLWKGEAP